MTLLASLARRWEASVWKEADGPLVPPKLAPRGAAPTNVGFEMVLDAQGRLLEARLLGAPNETPPRFRVMHLPDIERTSGDAPAFLWDKTEYLLGVTNVGTANAPEPGQKDKSQRRHDLLVAEMARRIGDDPDEGLRAVMAFLADWTPERFTEALSPDMLDLNGVFRLTGDRHELPDAEGLLRDRYVHERPAARALWMPEDPEPPEGAPMDLVAGEPTVPARLHSKIKGVAGGQAAGAPIASVNAPAFKSHGWAEGLDAPVSPASSHAYRTALNALLARDGGGRVRFDRGTTRHGARRRPPEFRNKGIVGDTTVAFWAERSGKPDADAEAVVGAALGATELPEHLWGRGNFASDAAPTEPPEADTEAETKRRAAEQRALGDAIGGLTKGRSVDLAPGHSLDPGTVIHVLGLSPNEGRISIRFHHVGSLGDLASNVEKHWEAMRLDGREGHPSARALVREAAVHRWDANAKLWKVQKDAEPPKRLAGELLRAILEGTKYPETLAAAILLRIRSERGHVNARRAAMLKAVFNRNHSKQHGGELMPGLRHDRLTQGYLLGQLFALYEKAENESQVKLVNGKRERRERNATLRDRYFTAAGAGPARVFPTLGNGHGHNMAKLRKRPEETFQRSHGYIEREVGRVMSGLPIDIPKTLSPPEQSEFIVGYWHMRTDRPLPSDDGNEDDTDLIDNQEPAQ